MQSIGRASDANKNYIKSNHYEECFKRAWMNYIKNAKHKQVVKQTEQKSKKLQNEKQASRDLPIGCLQPWLARYSGM